MIKFLAQAKNNPIIMYIQHEKFTLSTTTTTHCYEICDIIINLRIFQPLALYACISSFLNQQKSNPITFILLFDSDQAAIQEMVTATLPDQHLWEGYMIASLPINNYWYIAVIRNDILFQYQLFFATIQQHYTFVMTKTAAMWLASSYQLAVTTLEEFNIAVQTQELPLTLIAQYFARK